MDELASLHEENYIRLCLNQLNVWLGPKGLQPGLLEYTCDSTRLLQNHKETDHSDEYSFHRYIYSHSFLKNVNVITTFWRKLCMSIIYTIYIKLTAEASSSTCSLIFVIKSCILHILLLIGETSISHGTWFCRCMKK